MREDGVLSRFATIRPPMHFLRSDGFPPRAVFLNVAKDTVFIRLGLFDQAWSEYGPFVYAFLLSWGLRAGIAVWRALEVSAEAAE